MVNRLPLALLAAWLLLLLSPAWAASVQVEPDRNPVRADESFHLTFQTDGDAGSDPDFSPLQQNFEVLGQSQSSNLQVINGSVSRSVTWTLQLLPRQSGVVTIPAINFGRASSPPTPITVLPAGAALPGTSSATSRDLFLEVSAEPKDPYVQAQVIYTVRLFHSRSFAAADLTEPNPGDDAVVKKLGKDQHFETWRNGQRYQVVERRYAVFPQHSGKITIPPLTLHAQVPQAGGQSPFGSMFNGMPFDPFGQQLTTRVVHSDGVTLQVKPEPAGYGNAPWLPATKLVLRQQWATDPPTFRVGEPITRTLVLNATGLTAAQLPSLASAVPEGVKAYPDQPALTDGQDSDGLTGIRQESVALVPTRAGQITLPPIRLTWWNTQTDTRQTAELPAQTIDVLPASGSTASSTLPPPVPAQTQTEPAKATPAPAPQPATGESTPLTQPEATIHGSGPWPWISLILAIGWVTTAWLWWRSRRGLRGPATPKPPQAPTTKEARRAVLAACRADDPLALRKALLGWGAARWPNDPPKGLGELASRVSPQLAETLLLLERHLYGKDGMPWQSEPLRAAFEGEPKRGQTAPTSTARLPSLYPS